MSIEFVPCHKDRGFFICLAKEYVDELSEYDRRIVWDEDMWSKTMWDADFIVDGGVLCGFVCKNEVSFRGRKKILYISEFYIAKDERNRKVGLEAARGLVEGWNGDVCLYILDRNDGAKGFWDAVERELGWERIVRPEMKVLDGCELRVYKVG